MSEIVKLIVNKSPQAYSSFAENDPPAFSLLQRITDKDGDYFVEGKYESKCRDFVGSECLAAHFGITSPLYSSADNKNVILSNKETLVSMSLKPSDAPTLIKRVPILNELEEYLGVPPTKLYETGYISPTKRPKFVFVGDAFWMKSPHLISIYTFLLRCLTYYSTSAKEDNCKTIEDLFEYVIKYFGITSSDASFIKYMKEAHLYLRFYLLNIDRILGDNPLTGLNDKQIFADGIDWMCKPVSNSDNNAKYHTGVLSTRYMKGAKYHFSFSSIHSYAGISSVSNVINRIKAKEQEYISHITAGIEWAANYIDLCIEEGIFISNGTNSFTLSPRLSTKLPLWENNVRK